MKISVVGTGYVGLVAGTCLAELGHEVICVDKNEKKVEALNNGLIPIYEPGLDELIEKNVKESRLHFSTSMAEAVEKSLVIFVAVGTPMKDKTGEADLSYIEAVAREVALNMQDYKIIVEKSTVPVKTCEWIKRVVKLNNRKKIPFDVVSNPEFLREGSAINDFLYPDRIVVGVESEKAREIMRELYQPLLHRVEQEGKAKPSLIFTSVHSSEIIKHASNSFLATKISFINAVSRICELSGGDVEEVALGMGLDIRIGKRFLNAGIGYGGSCFPKDVAAFYRISEELGYDFSLLREVMKINENQKEHFINKVKKALWIVKDKKIAVLGLAFKPNTDDMREAPAIYVIRRLLEEGASVKAYDPQAMNNARQVLPEIEYGENIYDTVEGADVLLLLTEWSEFKEMDLEKVKQLLNYPIIIDGRNMFKPVEMKQMGFEYICMGRPEKGYE
jgi:UDPglucose 6-dehydrogenase